MAADEARKLNKRKSNWTQDECGLLGSLVNERNTILRGKLGPTLTSRMKKDTCHDVTALFNASALTPRSAEEVEKKWHNILSSAKTEISSFRRSSTGTGGGPPSKPLSALAECVEQVLGEKNVVFEGIAIGVDSSLIQLLNDEAQSICSIQVPVPREDECTSTENRSFSCILPYPSPLSFLSPTTAMTTKNSSQKSCSNHQQPPRSSISTSSTVVRPAGSKAPSNQQMIEELTIKKLKLEIEYYELKIKSAKNKLEE